MVLVVNAGTTAVEVDSYLYALLKIPAERLYGEIVCVMKCAYECMSWGEKTLHQLTLIEDC